MSAILGILCRRAKIEVLRVEAGGVVAGMADIPVATQLKTQPEDRSYSMNRQGE